MNKRVLLLLMVLGLLTVLSATPGADHKNLWCHYPPGQWTGVPGTASHVIILDIDVAADAKALAKHLGHSPSLNGGTCDPTTWNGTSASFCAEGVATDGTPDSCPGGLVCGQADVITEANGNISRVVDLVPGTGPNAGICVCPTNTPSPGNPPGAGGGVGSTTFVNCGSE